MRLTPMVHGGWLTSLVFFSLSGYAAELAEPLYSANRQVLVQIYGLPASRSALVLPEQQQRVRLQLEAANSFSRNTEQGESIVLDGETHRATLSWQYGLAEGVELGIEIPFISHESGRLDRVIDDWHNAFNLPEGDRPDFPNNQLHYRYSNNGEQLYELSDASSDLGDISLQLGYQLGEGEQHRFALRAGVKLPTGDEAALTGSGGVDAYASLHLSSLTLSRWRWHGSVGLLWMEQPEVLADLHNEWVIFASGTLAYMWHERLALKVQLDTHSAFYDSALTELGDASVQLLLGATVAIGDHSLLDLSVSEDIAVDTAPDVVFQLGLRRTW